jgi:hypothetical protein
MYHSIGFVSKHMYNIYRRYYNIIVFFIGEFLPQSYLIF